jgi:hypothetical protein
VQVTACNVVGLISYGEPRYATVRLLAAEQASQAAGMLAHKYPVKWRFLARLTRQQAYYQLLVP